MPIGTISLTAPVVNSTGTTTRNASASCNETIYGRKYTFAIYPKGKPLSIIASGLVTAANQSITFPFTYTDSNLLNLLDGASALSWEVVVREYDSAGEHVLATETKESTITIGSALRYGSVAHSNPPYDLDGTGQIIAVASRPSSHSGWRVRYQFYVNATLAFSRGFFSSSSDTTTLTFTPTAAEKAALLNAMGGVSPRTMEVRAVTGWNLSGGTTTLSGSNSSSQTNNIVKLFSSIKVRLAGVWAGKPIKVRVAGVWKNAIVKVWTGSSWKQAK